MKNFSGAGGVVTVVGKMARHESDFRLDFPEGLLVFVEAGEVRGDPGKNGGAAGATGRSGAVGVGEEDGLGGESLEVRSEGLRVTSEGANPVVEVIDGDEEDVERGRSLIGEQ